LAANTLLLCDVSMTGDAVSATTGRARPPNRKHHHQTNTRKPVTPYRYALANLAQVYAPHDDSLLIFLGIGGIKSHANYDFSCS